MGPQGDSIVGAVFSRQQTCFGASGQRGRSYNQSVVRCPCSAAFQQQLGRRMDRRLDPVGLAMSLLAGAMAKRSLPDRPRSVDSAYSGWLSLGACECLWVCIG